MSQDNDSVLRGEVIDEALCRLISPKADRRFGQLKAELWRRIGNERSHYQIALRYFRRRKAKPAEMEAPKANREQQLRRLGQEFNAKVWELVEEAANEAYVTCSELSGSGRTG